MLQPVATSTRLNSCRGANAGRHNKSDDNSNRIIFLTILDATLSEDLREQPQSQGPEHHGTMSMCKFCLLHSFRALRQAKSKHVK